MSSHLKESISDNVGKKSITQQQPETAHVALPALAFKRASGAKESLSHTEILQLQRTIGNRRVCRLLSNTPPIQPKQTVGPVGDKYEQKTDQVAENVVERINSHSAQPAQRREPEEEELLQGKFDSAQRQAAEDEDLLQGRFAGSEPPTQRQGGEDRGDNRTGMPDPLKAGLEQLSGTDLSGVRVHRNSAKPAQLNALAYTQGQDIHVGPGQERHMPHEGWHAVQQMQGRVKPTMQANGVSINDDKGLEHEADVMGVKAVQMNRADQGESSSVSQPSTWLQRRKLDASSLQKRGVEYPKLATEQTRRAGTLSGMTMYDVKDVPLQCYSNRSAPLKDHDNNIKAAKQQENNHEKSPTNEVSPVVQRQLDASWTSKQFSEPARRFSPRKDRTMGAPPNIRWALRELYNVHLENVKLALDVYWRAVENLPAAPKVGRLRSMIDFVDKIEDECVSGLEHIKKEIVPAGAEGKNHPLVYLLDNQFRTLKQAAAEEYHRLVIDSNSWHLASSYMETPEPI